MSKRNGSAVVGSKRHLVEVKSKPSRRAVVRQRVGSTDGASRLDAVRRWIHAADPTLSVDGLLSTPIEALRMGVMVAAKLKQISDAAAMKMLSALDALKNEHATELAHAHAICKATMNGRKRGLIKPLRPKRKERS